MTQVEERNVQLKHLLQKLDESRQEVRKQNKKLKNLASKDPLTDCLNRRSFFEQFDIHWNLSRRNDLKISCVMIDLDHFKSINDVHGHQKGDKVLKAVAQTLVAQLRGTDILCRYGGEEFCVLLPQMGIEGAMVAAERFRVAVELLRPEQLPVTIRVGVTTRMFGAASAELLLEQADQALYAAKKSGRNCVVRWDKMPELRSADEPEGHSEPDTSYRVTSPVSATPIPFHAVTSLITALAHRDAATATHSRRVADYCVTASQGMMSESELYILEIAALLHDIGKLGVPDAILLKPGPLTDEEWKVMGAHDIMGVDIITSAFNSEELSSIVRMHHSWYAGHPKSPDLPTGEDIPLGARILAIADAYDAITSDRVYRKGRSQKVAFAEIRRCAGTQFDPKLVERFIEAIMTHHNNESERVSHLSKQTALKIGLQIENLANAVDSNDYANLRTMAASLGSTAIEQGITSIAEVAVWLEHSTSAEQDPCEITQLAIDLLDLCRESQRSYLNGCEQMEFSQADSSSELEPAPSLA
jgi:diguanylate cyclase (GGDEF)-like protein